MKRILVACLLLASLCAGGCGKSGPAESNAAAPAAQRDEIILSAAEQATGRIETQAVVMGDAPDTLRVSGRIALADDRTWRVGVRSEGLVMKVMAGLGDYVKKGQILARYHADEVREARAEYRTAMANMTRLESGVAQAQHDYDRAQTLLSLKAASMQQVEEERQELVSAQAALKGGQIAVDRLKDQLEDDLGVPADPPPGTSEEIADDVPIFSPGDGYVIEKNVTPGKTVQVSAETFVIADLSQVWMLASVRQANLGALRVGQAATVTLAGLEGQRFSGKITNLGQELDPVTRVMQVRIALNNPGNKLRPEMLATAEIPAAQHKPVLLVASDAVQQINGQDIVFVKTAADRFTVRAVRAGETEDGKTPILEGLQAGEQVAVRGSFVLKSQMLKATMEE